MCSMSMLVNDGRTSVLKLTVRAILSARAGGRLDDRPRPALRGRPPVVVSELSRLLGTRDLLVSVRLIMRKELSVSLPAGPPQIRPTVSPSLRRSRPRCSPARFLGDLVR